MVNTSIVNCPSTNKEELYSLMATGIKDLLKCSVSSDQSLTKCTSLVGQHPV